MNGRMGLFFRLFFREKKTKRDGVTVLGRVLRSAQKSTE